MILASLRDQIYSNFNLGEIQDLCFDLGINYEDLPGNRLTDKSREIVAHCNRRGRLNELIDRCKELRPNSNWDIWDHAEQQEQGEESARFSQSIRYQMSEFNKAVSALTQDQYEIINWLRGQRRVSIAGCAGSGKTLVAAEKAIRLDGAGIRTLMLCHNPNLADYLRSLTRGTGVVVFEFTSWINAILENQYSTQTTWTIYSNYQEPLPQEIDKARKCLEGAALKFEAIIIDEAQDFREEWWNVIESALVVNGILYAFHDDNQALLPNRSVSFLKESPYILSKNCRNAGNVFRIIKCLHPQAPEVSRFLADKGMVLHTAFENFGEKDAIKFAVQMALEHFKPHEITVLTTEHPPNNQSILYGLEIKEEARWNWQGEILRVAALVSGFSPEVLQQKLSDSGYPTAADVQIVNDYFQPFAKSRYTLSHTEQRHARFKWQRYADSELRFVIPRRNHTQLLPIYFSSPKWAEDLPPTYSYQLVGYRDRSQDDFRTDEIHFCDVATFKGLESPAIILFVRSSRDNLDANLYVGMSRAVFYLHLITDKHLSAQFSKQAWFRRLLDYQNRIQSIR